MQSLCHLPDGAGRPENAPISSVHPVYFLRQMQDFRNGLRKSADPRKANTNTMIGFVKATTPEEDRAAAEFFAEQPYPRRLMVVESKSAPKVRLQGGMHMAIPAGEAGGMESIAADEIVEVPDDNLRAEARDTRMGWTAYVAPGTLKRGRQIAAKGQCATCHGSNLEGLGPVPPLAGRSPSYTMRQLFDFKTGATGPVGRVDEAGRRRPDGSGSAGRGRLRGVDPAEVIRAQAAVVPECPTGADVYSRDHRPRAAGGTIPNRATSLVSRGEVGAHRQRRCLFLAGSPLLVVGRRLVWPGRGLTSPLAHEDQTVDAAVGWLERSCCNQTRLQGR
jgi:cytochrome c553